MVNFRSERLQLVCFDQNLFGASSQGMDKILALDHVMA